MELSIGPVAFILYIIYYYLSHLESTHNLKLSSCWEVMKKNGMATVYLPINKLQPMKHTYSVFITKVSYMNSFLQVRSTDIAEISYRITRSPDIPTNILSR